MSSHPVAADALGKTVLLMGNEAIARGAIEAGISLAAGYPGTPSTEIGDTLCQVADALGFHFEWSSNEKVALEVAFGASMCDQRGMVSMKNVGLNVALDILNLISLRGVKGGLVIVSADDPSQQSSGQEQDNRWLAKMNCVPVLEPSSPQDAKDCTRYAFELSERHRTPVIVRTVTRLSHMRSNVKLGPIHTDKKKGEFDWQGFSYRVTGFDKLFRREKELNDKLDRIQDEFENLSFNRLKLVGNERFGLIGVGLCFSYAIDALRRIGAEDQTAYLKLTSSYPLPVKQTAELLRSVDHLLVAEEVDPFVELHIRALAKECNPNLVIHGRMSGDLPREGELSEVTLTSALTRILGLENPIRPRPELESRSRETIFERMLTLCAGCPHRATVYALKQAVLRVKGDLNNVVINGDIGCYGLAHSPPMSFEDTYFCMGASIGVSQGMKRAGIDSIAFIGDGTFFHAGIPALINAVYNKADIKIVVADNQTIAMTGFQPQPESGKTATGKQTKRIMIEDIARGCGVEYVEVVDAYKLEEVEKALEKMLMSEGVAMVIARRICATEAIRLMRPSRPTPYEVRPQQCIGCLLCRNSFGCPALGWNEEAASAQIDETICMGCGVCSQVCPQGAIGKKEGT